MSPISFNTGGVLSNFCNCFCNWIKHIDISQGAIANTRSQPSNHVQFIADCRVKHGAT